MEEIHLMNNKPLKAEWWRRLFGYVIDTFPILIFSMFIASEISPGESFKDIYPTIFMFIFLPYVLYFEGVFNRTFGKFITETIIIDRRTFKKPSFEQIVGRMLSRLIPFDALSFLSSRPRGRHDSIPNTMVTTTRSLNPYKSKKNKEVILVIKKDQNA
ncbi:MAG: RDD family protein [Thermaurantimonas sp.]|uniref:RDD family protein n=1 Tax=Thermaurantimonas sp. TaxID=2681568 RepID=UPI00391C4454